jgi:hypothetical protein
VRSCWKPCNGLVSLRYESTTVEVAEEHDSVIAAAWLRGGATRHAPGQRPKDRWLTPRLPLFSATRVLIGSVFGNTRQDAQ